MSLFPTDLRNYTSDWLRILPGGNTTAGAFTLPLGPVASIPTPHIDTMGSMGISFRFYGTDADLEAFNYRVIAYERINRDLASGSDKELFIATIYGSGLATLGPLTGIAGTLIPTSQFFVDLLTYTPTAYATALEAAFGRASGVYSPNDNTNIARLFIPNLGDIIALAVDFDMTTAASGNGLYNRHSA
jgi:hypothetical protein